MTNSTTNTTTNTTTTKSILLALSVAMTMGAASALSVPGLPTGVDFEFSKPGISLPGQVDQNGGGVGAITNITDILSAVGATGGTNINQDHFWKAMVDPTERNVFDYGVAKKYIDELVFTVQGEYASGLELDGKTLVWSEADEAKIAEITALQSTLSNGNVVDGNLKETRLAAVSLLSMLGLETTVDTDGEVTLTDNGTVTLEAVKALALDETSTGLKVAASDAGLNVAGFENANKLINMIAMQLKTGFILNTDNVTNTVEEIAGQHNNFMAHSIVDKAKSLKDIIKAIGLEETVIALVKTGDNSCTTALGNNSEACVAIGKKVSSISTRLPVFGGSEAGTYNASIAAIGDLANDVISFNNTVGTFNASDAADALDAQFGTITVDSESVFATELKAGDAEAIIDAEFALIGDTAGAFDGGFEVAFDDELDLVVVRTAADGSESSATKTISTH